MRIFTAINLPEQAKDKLAEYQKNIKEKFDFPAKWVDKDNFHITLLFFGFLKESGIKNLLSETEKITKKLSFFSLTLNKISYAPPETDLPKMIWARADSNEKVNVLCGGAKILPHVTLSRIKKARDNFNEFPFIEEEIDISFKVDKIDVMESFFKKEGPEYKKIISYSLKN